MLLCSFVAFVARRTRCDSNALRRRWLLKTAQCLSTRSAQDLARRVPCQVRYSIKASWPRGLLRYHPVRVPNFVRGSRSPRSDPRLTGRKLMWVVPQLLAFAPAARPRLASPMAAFVTTTPISAKLLMLPEAVSAMDSTIVATSTLAVVGPAGTELAFVAFSFFQAALLPYMAFACFIGWVGSFTPTSVRYLQFIPLFVLSCGFTGFSIKSAQQRVEPVTALGASRPQLSHIELRELLGFLPEARMQPQGRAKVARVSTIRPTHRRSLVSTGLVAARRRC